MGGDLDPVKLSIKLSLLGAVPTDLFWIVLRSFYRQSVAVLSLGKEGWDKERPQLEIPSEKNKALASSDPRHKGDGKR